MRTILIAFVAITLLAVESFAATYYVSVTGSDSNPGNEESPFATIQKAADVMISGDDCNIGAGTYREAVTPPTDGVTFRALPGAEVTVSAYRLKNAWRVYSESIYESTMYWTLGDENQLLYNGEIMNLARWPNKTNYDPFDLEAYWASGNTTSISHPGIPDWDWSNGGVVYFLGKNRWTSWRRPITASSAGVVNFAPLPTTWDYAGSHSPALGGEFFLSNILPALDSEGEWYVDSALNKIFFWAPGGGSPADGTCLVRRRTEVFDLTGRTGVTIDGLTIEGGHIDLRSARNCVVENCRIQYGNHTIASDSASQVPNTSILMNNASTGVIASRGNIIRNCDIQWGAGNGVQLNGVDNELVDSRIGNFNYLGSYACPIMLAGNNVKITRNEIFNGGRDLIRGGWSGADVGYNDMHHSNLINDDCGAIYTCCSSFNYTRIHHNLIHDCYSRTEHVPSYKAAGIYLDNSSKQLIVDHNVVWNVGWTCIQVNWAGTDLMLYNNTLWSNSGSHSASMGFWSNGYNLSNVKLYNTLANQGSFYATDQSNNIVLPLLDDPFVDFAARDFTPRVGTAPVDAGMIIPDYTDEFNGSAPDVGAFENWEMPEEPTPTSTPLPTHEEDWGLYE